MNIVEPKRDAAPDPQADTPGRDDVWVPSSCSLCYASCSLLAHRVDGVVVKLEGNPKSNVGNGRLCGKGAAGIMSHYDPNRVTKPLRRTNPEKGFGIDPGWKEVSWDEAITEIAAELKRIRADNPLKLVMQRTTTTTSSRIPFYTFSAGFGTHNHMTGGGGLHCGNGAHQISGTMHASWSILPDFQYCNYALYFGASKGHSAGHASCTNMGMAADARARGMKMVVVDPFCNFAAAKGTEWVPIRVGTDAGLALAIANELVNELGAVDEPFLKAKTNGAYLIGPDRKYVRDADTGKPLVWDEANAEAVPFDGTDSDNMALAGEYQVAGASARPAFALIAEHLKKYTPEKGEEISTVPADDIRRLAREFAEEARIGSTIVIDGVQVPYRPVAAIAFRGSQGHKNSTYNMLAVDLLNMLVGSADMAGGCIGFNPACHGYPETGRLRYVPHPDADGLMLTGIWLGPHGPWPVADPKLPERFGFQDLFPMSMASPFIGTDEQEAMWDRFELAAKPEMMLNIGANMLLSMGNRDQAAEAIKKYKLVVSFDLFLTEASEFADIILPDAANLEIHDSRSNHPFIFSHPAGMGDWCWPIRQPVLAPVGECRNFVDVLLELADRAGFLPDFHAAFNAFLDLQPPYRLDPDQRYTFEEICDRDLKDKFGPEKGLGWFKREGVLRWPKKPEEVYWRHFEDVRVPIYWEWMPDMWEKTNAIAAPRGLEIDKDYYEPLPDWLPCASHECETPGFDFYTFYYRDIIHANSFTMENAWLDEAARLDPFSYMIAINTDEARKRGLKTGDAVWLESESGRRVKGRLRLTEGIHPEGLAIGACAGHWAEGMPVAKGKGVRYNELLELEYENSSPSNLNLDLCVKVKLSKVTGNRP